MAEKPILFSAPMVRAILDGSKTQTRRVVKGMALDWLENAKFTPNYVALPENNMCHLGRIGDRLWVRENFQPLLADEKTWDDMPHVNYKTGEGYTVSYPATDGIVEFVNADDEIKDSVTPSIHMPRWASRITLEITGVRVERLQDISEEDAKAEGCKAIEGCKWHTFEEADAGIPMHEHTARDAFGALWESINGEESWAANPWVWVIEFRRV